MTRTDGRTWPGSADAPAPDVPAPDAADDELPLSRPYVDLPAGGPRGGPLRMPRFTPRQPGTPDAAPPPPPGNSQARPALRPPPRPVRRPDRSARAVIGDEIRIPVMWCQFGSCIARYTHRGALGERDLRARALGIGWRYDALGRLACPDCAQHDPTFWSTRAPTPVTGHPIWAG